MSTNSARNLTQESRLATERLKLGGRWLLDSVIAGLRMKGRRSLRAWCLAEGEDQNLARHACLGTSNTKDAQRLRRKLIRAAGLNDEGE